MPKLVLFDIDGTLVLTGGAGVRAMTRACDEIVGSSNALHGVAVAGRTDWIILSDALERMGRDLDQDLFSALRDRYVEYLRAEIKVPGHGVKAVMPGIQALLDDLQARDGVYLGLLTGNFEAGARIKLEYFDLWRYFQCGAFGDDAADRNALVPFAVSRARECGVPELAPQDILVVGDTPHDIACARAVGATPVAVATGMFTPQQLRDSGADIVFRDLSDTAAFTSLLTLT
jgi:phosphoglycolate phosphatase-like HAD superfamily hydrolase